VERRRLNRSRFAILCVLGYVALAWAVRFDMGLGSQIASLAYPLDTFSMYAGPPGKAISHLAVRDERGEVHRVDSFTAYECEEPLARSAARCAQRPGYAYHYDDLIHYIEDHRGPGTTRVELVYRTWHIRPGAAPELDSDCVVSRCRVTR
jgi:hypothetical protein